MIDIVSLLKKRLSTKKTNVDITSLLSTQVYVLTNNKIDVNMLTNEYDDQISILEALAKLINKHVVLKKDLYLEEDLWVVEGDSKYSNFINDKRYILNPHLINYGRIKMLNTELSHVQSNKKSIVLPNLSGGAQSTINGEFHAMLNILKSNIIMNGGSITLQTEELLDNGNIQLNDADLERLKLILKKTIKYNERSDMIYNYIKKYNELPEHEKNGDIKKSVDTNMKSLEKNILKDQQKSKLINTSLYDHLIKVVNNNKSLKDNTVEYKEKKMSMKNKIAELINHFVNLGNIMTYNFRSIEDRHTKKELENTEKDLDDTERELEDTQMFLDDAQGYLEDTERELENTERELERERDDQPVALRDNELYPL